MSTIENTCRCCLSNNSETLNLFSNFHVTSNLTLCEELRNCTNIKISEDDDQMSKFICLKCIENLYSACAFRKQCINSDFIWRLKIVKNKDILSDPLSVNDKEEKTNNDLLVKDNKKTDKTENQIYSEIKTEIIEIDFIDEMNNEDEPEVFKCGNCDYLTTFYKDLTNHLKIHTNKSRAKISCTICNKITFNINKHMQKNHIYKTDNEAPTVRKSYLCNICGRSFSQRCTLKKHLLRHDNENEIKAIEQFSCNNCDKTFCNNTHLKRHKKVHEECKKDEKIFLCNFCGKNFRAARYLENHMSSIHNGEKKFICEICCKTFNREDSLASHRRTHTGEKPYECKICFKKFAQRNTLGTHMFLHTGKKVKCPLCEKMFSRPSMLIVHNREHTGEKPYNCDQCDRKFSQKCHLTAHKNSHLNVKQFQCDVCQKEFRQKTTLRQHMFIHTGKPHQCSKCPASFIKKDRFRAHLRMHHNVEIHNEDSDFAQTEIQSNIEITTCFEHDSSISIEKDVKQKLYS